MSTAPISSTPSVAPASSVAASSSASSSSTSSSSTSNSSSVSSATASSGDTVSISDAANAFSTGETDSNTTTSINTNEVMAYQFDSGTTVSVYQTITETVTKGIAKTGHALLDEMNQKLIETFEEAFGKEYTETKSETSYSATITNADGSTETIELNGDVIFSEDENGNFTINYHSPRHGDLEGTNSNDLIINMTNNQDIKASGGNDTYFIAGNNTMLDLAESSSTVYGHGSNTYIKGGDGNHNIQGNIYSVELGSGDNTIKGNISKLRLEDGNNTLEGYMYNVVIGDGNNSFTGNTHTFKIGHGDNTLVFNSVSMNHTSLHLGNGNNNMTIKHFESSFPEHVNIQMSDGKPLGIYSLTYGDNTKLFYEGKDLIAKYKEDEQRRYDLMKKKLEEEDPEELQKRIEEDKKKRRELAQEFFNNSVKMFESLIARINSKAGFDRDTIDKEAQLVLAQTGMMTASLDSSQLTEEEAEHLKTLSKELHTSYEKVYGEKIYDRALKNYV